MSGICIDEWCLSIGKLFLTGVFKGKSQMVRAITAAGCSKAVMNVNRQVSAASAAPLERDESLRAQGSAVTSGAVPVASFPYCRFQKEIPKWCTPITAADMLEKAVTDVSRQVSAASTDPLERDESLRVQGSAVTSGAVSVASFSPYCRLQGENPKWCTPITAADMLGRQSWTLVAR